MKKENNPYHQAVRIAFSELYFQNRNVSAVKNVSLPSPRPSVRSGENGSIHFQPRAVQVN